MPTLDTTSVCSDGFAAEYHSVVFWHPSEPVNNFSHLTGNILDVLSSYICNVRSADGKEEPEDTSCV